MPAPCPLYHTLTQQLTTLTAPAALPAPSLRRLAPLVTGIVAAQSTALARVAAELFALRLTRAATPESVGRRVRRTLSDPLLIAEECYEPVLRRGIAWSSAGTRPLLLVIDESSKGEVLHLFRISLAYRGTALPLVWAVWEQNAPLPEGAYWAMVDAALDRLAALLPTDHAVCIVADRAYAVAPLLDRLDAHGWHWVIRITTTGSHRFRDAHGREWALRDWLARRAAAGSNGKGGVRCSRGRAGGRSASSRRGRAASGNRSS